MWAGKDRRASRCWNQAGPCGTRETLPASCMGQTDRRGSVHLWASTRPLGSEGEVWWLLGGRECSWHVLCMDQVMSPELQGAVPAQCDGLGVTEPCSGTRWESRETAVCSQPGPSRRAISWNQTSSTPGPRAS